MKQKHLLSILLAFVLSTYTAAQELGKLDSLMLRAGMVDLQSLDSTIRVDLRYAQAENFTGEKLYNGLTKAYLEPQFAKRVAQAQRKLQKTHPGYSLIIYDVARPISVQRRMRQLLSSTAYKAYVADGRRGGRHNYGVAVDLSIVDTAGRELDMGSPFDHFGMTSHLGRDEFLVRKALISKEAQKNRALLQALMQSVGLRPYVKEWWHYQEPISMNETRRRYRLLDF